jgi:putative ABC transport system permease protein
MMMGWINTISAIIEHAGVDLWVMAEQTPAFDYGTQVPRQRLYQVRSVEGVQWAESMVIMWGYWHRPDGRRINVEVIGLDHSGVGGPWQMAAGNVADAQLPDSVIVDEMFVQALGIHGVGDEVEILGKRAVVRGLSRQVRTFTAAPFVFTSIKSAVDYDSRYRDDEVTYLMVRCAAAQSPGLGRTSSYLCRRLATARARGN